MKISDHRISIKTLRPSDKGWSQKSNQTHIGWCENYIDGWQDKLVLDGYAVIKDFGVKRISAYSKPIKRKNGDIDAPSFKTIPFNDLKPGKYNSLIKVVPPSCPENKYLKIISPSSEYLYDFAFIGHYEPDGRLNVIRQLLRMGYRCLVVGLRWPEKILGFSNKNNSKIENKNLNYSQYLSLLSCARVNLGFISRINRDSYTRRYFECPFSNSLFLAYESNLYKQLSQNMPNILFYKTMLPTVADCIRALKFSMLSGSTSSMGRLLSMILETLSYSKVFLSIELSLKRGVQTKKLNMDSARSVLSQ